MFSIDPKYQPETMFLANKLITLIADAKHPLRGRISILNNKGAIWVGTAIKVAFYAVKIAAIYVYEKGKEFYLKKIKREAPKAKLPVEDVSRLFNANYEASESVSPTNMGKQLEAQVNSDISRLSNEKEMRRYCTRVIKEEKLFETLAPKHSSLSRFEKEEKIEVKREKYINQALSVYSSSYEHFAPVVLDWAHSLLETAASTEPPQRLIFMARDGTAPYKVAKLLKKKYPEKYGKVPLTHVYTSRELVGWSMENDQNKEMFRKYLTQNGLKQGESVIFVDVGFEASKKPDIESMLKPITENIQFSFLISINKKVNGFVADYDNRLEAIPRAGQNLAVHWLEDTHQKVVNSPTHLVECESGIVRPNTKAGVKEKGEPPKTIGKKPNGQTKYEKLTCKEKLPKSYFFKLLGFKAIMDYAAKSGPTPFLEDKTIAIANRKATPAQVKALDQFLMLFRNRERRSIVKHV